MHWLPQLIEQQLAWFGLVWFSVALRPQRRAGLLGTGCLVQHAWFINSLLLNGNGTSVKINSTWLTQHETPRRRFRDSRPHIQLNSLRRQLTSISAKAKPLQKCNQTFDAVRVQVQCCCMATETLLLLLYTHRPQGPLGPGSPGRPPRLLHSPWALNLTQINADTQINRATFSRSVQPNGTARLFGVTNEWWDRIFKHKPIFVWQRPQMSAPKNERWQSLSTQLFVCVVRLTSGTFVQLPKFVSLVVRSTSYTFV